MRLEQQFCWILAQNKLSLLLLLLKSDLKLLLQKRYKYQNQNLRLIFYSKLDIIILFSNFLYEDVKNEWMYLIDNIWALVY